MKKRLLSVLLTFAMVLTLLPASALAVEVNGSGRTSLRVEKVDNDSVSGETFVNDRHEFTPAEDAKQTLNSNEVVRVSIVLEKPSTIAAGYSTTNIASNASAMSYRDGLRQEQATVQSAIERDVLGGASLDVAWNLTLAANIISANVRRGDIEAIEAVPGVESVFVERQYSPDVISVGGEKDPDMAVSGQMTGAQNAWDIGYTGAGSKIAIIDTGLDTDHQSFNAGAFNYSLTRQGFDRSNLMDADDIALVFDKLNIAGDVGASPEILYRTSKVPYGWSYIDHDDDITHDNDTEGEHGSHVAGIAAANSYVDTDKDGVYEKAIDAVGMQGNAPDAQLLIMKVFGNRGGAYDADCVAAIEDAILLGADSVNLSLGMALPGFSNPTAADDPYVELMNELNNTDTVVVYSAGNAGAWADNSANGNLYSDGMNFSMGGESGSYTNSFTVASVENDGAVSPTIEVNGKKYGYSETLSANGPIAALDTKDKNTYDFVFVNGYGETVEEYTKAGVEGKIAFIWRGNGVNFTDKHANAEEAGAIALVVVNNQPGSISMQLGTAEIPAVAITLAAGTEIWEGISDEELEIGAGNTASGKITIHSEPEAISYNSDHYTMSSFSSWGITGALEMKPEISAPGGGIWSVNGAVAGGQAYELMSGTSMAAPQITGLAALVQQHIRKNGYDEGMTPRALTMALLMSTAKPMKDAAEGNYYSLLQQGAGIANVEAAVTTPAYITVDGRDDGKVKAEIGEDPAKTGEYTVNFTVHNLTGEELYYAFDADVFTQASEDGLLLKSTSPVGATVDFYVGGEKLVNDDESLLKYDFNGDNRVDKADAQLLLDYVMGNAEELPYNANNANVDGTGDVDTHDVHALLAKGQAYAAVPANGSVDVTAVISGFELDKTDYPTGGYVEAYISAEAKCTDEGVIYPTLNLPVLGYYGSWTEPSMYEIGTGDEWWEAYELGDYTVGGRYPYTAEFIFDGQGNDGLTNIPMESVDDSLYVLTSGGALSTDIDALSYRYTPIRNSGNGMAQITYVDANGDTQVLWRSEDFGPQYGVTYYENADMWLNPGLTGSLYYALYNEAEFDWVSTIEAIQALPKDTVKEVTLSVVLAPEYYASEDGSYDWDALTDGDSSNGELGAGAYMSSTFAVDITPPEVVDAYSEKNADDHNVITVSVKDDVSVVDVVLYNSNGDLMYEYNPTLYSSAEDALNGKPNFTPTEPDAVAELTFDGLYDIDYDAYYETDEIVLKYVSPLEDDLYEVQVRDVAGNVSTYRLLSGLEPTDVAGSIEVSPTELLMLAGTTAQLTAEVGPVNLTDMSVTWSTGDAAVATVDAETGLVTAVSAGTTTITATTNANGEDGKPLTATCEVGVFTIPTTATGILGDAKGYAKMFTWDFEAGDLAFDAETQSSETIYPNALTRYTDDTILVVDGDGTMYQLPKEGGSEALKTSAPSAYEVIPYDMTYSANSGFWWTYNGYLLNEEDPLAPEMYGFELGSSYGTIYAIANTDENWHYNYQGQDLSGDSVIYRLTDEGYLQITLLYNDAQNALSLSLDLGVDTLYEGYQGQPYSNMVIGEDGALYISIMRNDTNEVYRLEFLNDDDTTMSVQDLLEAEEISYSFTAMGNFGDGVWPALFLDVKNNGTAPAAAGNTVYGVAEAVETTAVEAQSFQPEEIKAEASKPETATGSLNTIDVGEETSESKTNGITVDSVARTVTVPVSSNSTNGRFSLAYDTSVLTLKSVTPTTATITSCVETLPAEDATNKAGSVEVGFASKSAVNGPVANVVFSYESTGVTSITLKVTEDGTSDANVSKDYSVTLSAYIPVPSTPSTPSTPSEPEPFRFVDVPENSWYGDAIYSLYEMGLIEGVGADSYAPNDNINRAAIATILYRLADKPATESSVTFTDVASTDWYADAVNWAATAGYMVGFGDGTFGASQSITRQDMIVTLWRYAKANGYDVGANGFVMPDFTDIDDVADYAKEAMCWAVRVGITNGVGDSSLDPTGTATRAQTATMIYRFVSLNPTETEQ